MAASIDPLVVGRVIGDVVDMFVPSVSMSVRFATKHVTNGCTLKPSLTSDPPRVLIGGRSQLLYTLVMTDPDAPSPSEPTQREWVHWYVRRTVLPSLYFTFNRLLAIFLAAQVPPVASGKEILSYVAPKPTVGIHRYILVLYEHTQPVGPSAEPPESRANFNTRRFADELQLGLPVATFYFNAQKEPATRTRR
ncbi:hypothetical protein V2J09_014839 [Rumex salicifolius]